MPGDMIRLLLLPCLLVACLARAEDARVAVAANFAPVAQQLAAQYAQAGGGRVEIVAGGTGKLLAQIAQGAPFDALLAADEASAEQLVREGRGVRGSTFVYATGRLALWSADARRVRGPETLRDADVRRIAVAHPVLAPYGAAARQTLATLGLLDAVSSRLVTGENIAQTHQFVASGNAEIGFVAWSQVVRDGAVVQGSAWLVPSTMHAPLRQAAVLLVRGADNSVVRGFLDYLRAPSSVALMRRYGYE